MSADHLVAVHKSFSKQISVRHSLRLAEHCITFTALLTSMRFSLQVTFYPHIQTALYSFSFKPICVAIKVITFISCWFMLINKKD